MAISFFFSALLEQNSSSKALRSCRRHPGAGAWFASEYKSDREFEVQRAQGFDQGQGISQRGAWHSLAIEEVVVACGCFLETATSPRRRAPAQGDGMMIDQSLMTANRTGGNTRAAGDDGGRRHRSRRAFIGHASRDGTAHQW